MFQQASQKEKSVKTVYGPICANSCASVDRSRIYLGNTGSFTGTEKGTMNGRRETVNGGWETVNGLKTVKKLYGG